MKMLTDSYFPLYKGGLPGFSKTLENFLSSVKELDFSCLIEASSVFSSNIEGNTLDLNSFQNARMNRETSKDREEIEDLIAAYTFAQESPLTEKNFLHTHTLSSKTLLIASKQGTYRDDPVGVFGKEGLIYLAIEAEHVKIKMGDLFDDIGELLMKKLEVNEVFYYTSLIHLVFVHIHPFADGNGRSARLLEKWFLTSKLGQSFWNISSEEYYLKHRSEYYKNINLGVNYYELDYNKCLPFLHMLTESINI